MEVAMVIGVGWQFTFVDHIPESLLLVFVCHLCDMFYEQLNKFLLHNYHHFISFQSAKLQSFIQEN
jgi:hypothetical protein